jgi:hypothetical protein
LKKKEGKNESKRKYMSSTPLIYYEEDEYDGDAYDEPDERDTLKHELQRAHDEKQKEILNRYAQTPRILYINPTVVMGFLSITTMYSKKYSKNIILCGDRHVRQLKCKPDYRYLPSISYIDFIENLIMSHEGTKMFIETVSEEVAMLYENSRENYIREFNAYFERFKHTFPSKLNIVESDVRKIVNKLLSVYDTYVLWNVHVQSKSETPSSNLYGKIFSSKYKKLQRLERELDTPMTWELFYSIYSSHQEKEEPPIGGEEEKKEPQPPPIGNSNNNSVMSALTLRSLGVDFFIHDDVIFEILYEINLLDRLNALDNDDELKNLGILSWFWREIEAIRVRFFENKNVVLYLLETCSSFVNLFVILNLFMSPEKNIILYFGNNHIIDIGEFLLGNGFDIIDSYTSSTKGVDHQCIRVQNFVDVFDLS